MIAGQRLSDKYRFTIVDENRCKSIFISKIYRKRIPYTVNVIIKLNSDKLRL